MSLQESISSCVSQSVFVCERDGRKGVMDTTCGEKDKRSPRIVGESAVEEDEEILQKRISGHPLFGPLIGTHLNCLKVGLSEFGEVGITTELGRAADSKPNNDIIHNPSDLDHFMHFHVNHLRLPVLCSVCFQGTYICPVFTPVPFENLQEAYCMALCNLKKGTEEAQQEYASFIKATYVQLGEFTHTNYP